MAKSVEEKILKKREKIARIQTLIAEKTTEIEILEQEILDLGVLEIRGVLNEVNMPLEDFLSAMRSKLIPQKKEVSDEKTETEIE